LGIGDWAQSPIPNPQSPIPNPQLNLINKFLYLSNFKMLKIILPKTNYIKNNLIFDIYFDEIIK
jgi:hypothetical protein